MLDFNQVSVGDHVYFGTMAADDIEEMEVHGFDKIADRDVVMVTSDKIRHPQPYAPTNLYATRDELRYAVQAQHEIVRNDYRAQITSPEDMAVFCYNHVVVPGTEYADYDAAAVVQEKATELGIDLDQPVEAIHTVEDLAAYCAVHSVAREGDMGAYTDMHARAYAETRAGELGVDLNSSLADLGDALDALSEEADKGLEL